MTFPSLFLIVGEIGELGNDILEAERTDLVGDNFMQKLEAVVIFTLPSHLRQSPRMKRTSWTER